MLSHVNMRKGLKVKSYKAIRNSNLFRPYIFRCLTYHVTIINATVSREDTFNLTHVQSIETSIIEYMCFVINGLQRIFLLIHHRLML